MNNRIKILWPVYDLYKGDNQFVGIMIMSSLLKQHGFESYVIEADFRDIEKIILDKGISIVAFSTPTVYCQEYLKLNKKIKSKFNVFSVFGGPHPTYFPEMINEEGVDCVCVGEGEYPMLELVRALEEGSPIGDIQNLWVKKEQKVFKNNVRPLVKHLDELPLPDHDLFRKAVPHATWKAVVLTSRGCPYHCSYCYNNAYKKIYEGMGPLVRRRSVDNVIEELRLVKRHKCYQYIQFLDDLFTLSGDWIKEFSIKYKREVDLPFSCLVRADFVTEEMIRDLKLAGCCRILVGVETGDNELRKNIFKRSMTDESIINACKMIKKEGIKLMTANILGIPGGSIESDFKTMELNVRLKPDYAGVNLLQPYKGTEIHDIAKKMGMIREEEGDRREATVSKTSTLYYAKSIDKRMVENFQKLFPIAVEFPSLIPIIKKLILLPQNKLYYLIFAAWVNYCHYFRIIPVGIGLKNVWKRAKLYHRCVLFLRNFKILIQAPGEEHA